MRADALEMYARLMIRRLASKTPQARPNLSSSARRGLSRFFVVSVLDRNANQPDDAD
jgi:hypothetical protein